MPPRTLTGVGVSAGRGAGPVVVAPPRVPAAPGPGVGPVGGDIEAVAVAAQAVRAELESAAAAAEGDARAVLAATAMMATDRTLLDAAQDLVRDGVPAARAVWDAATRIMSDLRGLGGPMSERAWDVADVRDRIVARLTGRQAPVVAQPDTPFVLVATDLTPVDVAMLDVRLVRGIVTARGGPVSHTAILARALGIPTVMGVHGAARLTPGTSVVVDGGAGTVTVRPDPAEVAAAEDARNVIRRFDGHGHTADGVAIPLLANVGRPEDAAAAAAAGAEGVGLLRTEFCFLGRRTPPTADEQAEAYLQVFTEFAGRPVVVRTVDAGSDSGVPFLAPTADEPNPALGVRGIRAFASDGAVLEAQLGAVADAARRSGALVQVMAPMVTTVAEVVAFAQACARHGLDTVGVTVEVPAAALRAGSLLRHAGFASIGTNDLTQYAMAADRAAPQLAHLCTPWQPAVLELVAAACRAGTETGRPVGVCGEAAADPALAVVLVGLGATSLSMSARALGDVAAVLAATTSEHCRRLATEALACDGADEARAAVRAGLPVLAELGL